MPKPSKIKFLFIVITIFIAACIETDIYLPAFPDMMAYFSTTEGEIQNLLSWNFLGICLSCPLYGPLSDAFGRKKPLIMALALFLGGSILTLFASSFDYMLWGRVLQGLGSGGCFVLGTAILFDAFQKDEAIEMTNHLNTIVPLLMAAAPILGGYLNYNFGFRSNFLAIALIVLISLGICLFLFTESLPKEQRTPLKGKQIARDLSQVVRSGAFWQLTLAMSLPFAGYISFLSGTAVLFVVEFGMSQALFPIIQAVLLGGWVLGSLFLKSALIRFGAMTVKKAGIICFAIGGVILGAATWLSPQDPIAITAGMVFYAFGANWIIGLYFPAGMELFPQSKGMVASILTSVRLCIAASVVGMAGTLYNQTIYPLSTIVFGTIIITLPLLIAYEKKKKSLQPIEGAYTQTT